MVGLILFTSCHLYMNVLKKEKYKNSTIKSYTKKALNSAIFAGIGFGIVLAGIDYYDEDDFELWKLICKVLCFAILMGLYFNYSFKRKSKKESN